MRCFFFSFYVASCQFSSWEPLEEVLEKVAPAASLLLTIFLVVILNFVDLSLVFIPRESMEFPVVQMKLISFRSFLRSTATFVRL